MGVVGKWFSFGRNEHYDAAIRHLQLGEFLEAIEQFKICLSSDPDPSTRERAKSYIAGTLGKLAREEIALRDWSRALHFLDEAVQLRPGFADLRILRSQVFHALNKEEDRMFEIRFALDLNPRYGFAILQDGLSKVGHGDEAAGIARVRESADADPRLNTDLFREAMDLWEAGKKTEALSRFKEVVPVVTNDAETIIRAADAFAQSGRWQDAAEAYRRALEVAPRFADVRCHYGQVLLELDEVGQAIAEFREAVTINPRYADAYALLGVSYRREGNEEQAQSAFRAALEADPVHPIASLELEQAP